ncbi:hypothetical protein HZB04_01340 [Candidatus Wolfebacteria bacterium]|nr:hypothetical protein [Candidatus Wolfebacteria bacterium]
MVSNLFFRIPRRLKIFVFFLLLILAAYFVVRFLIPQSKQIPPDFLKARQESSLIASEIIDISNKTSQHINQISDFDKNKQYEEALKLISEELVSNREARNRAVNLSAQLEIMTKNIPEISPVKLGQIALEAIGSETTLISRLITYNDYLIKLLEILQAKFLEKEKNANDKITELIGKINGEAESINSLDKNFNNLMVNFDKEK